MNVCRLTLQSGELKAPSRLAFVEELIREIRKRTVEADKKKGTCSASCAV